MNKTICALDISSRERIPVDYIPETVCPICGFSLAPDHIESIIYNLTGTSELAVMQFCYHCNRAFISYYRGTIGYLLELYQSSPKTLKNLVFDEVISNLSPKFVTTFNQTFSAENLELFEVCGPGYRKALEFLIKDYLIYSRPEKAEDIKQNALAKCITDYIDDQTIKDLALRTAWIGNDLTHYNKSREESNFELLKDLIDLCLAHIVKDIKTKKMIEKIKKN